VSAASISCFHLSVIFPLFLGSICLSYLPFRLSFFHSVMSCLSLTTNYDHILQLQLLWIILVASCAALIIQSLAARLGVVTGLVFLPLRYLSLLICCFLQSFLVSIADSL
jgi:hypothetical protein